MNSSGQFLLLGSGGSMGVPVIGCKCPVCQSSSPFNKRLRPSALATIGGKKFLIDCGPDFKQQALKWQLDSLDGVIFTHAHNDHTAGIDELRVFCLQSGHSMPCLLSEEAAIDLKRRFYYLFENGPYAKFIAHFDLQLLEAGRGQTVFEGLHIDYFSYEQANMRITGYRFGDLAYVTDIKRYPTTIFEDLKGVKTLIISALRFDPSPMHLSIDEAIDFAKKVGAEKTWFMHIAHELDHEKANAYLPENIRMAYDGLELEFHANMTDSDDSLPKGGR